MFYFTFLRVFWRREGIIPFSLWLFSNAQAGSLSDSIQALYCGVPGMTGIDWAMRRLQAYTRNSDISSLP